MGDGASLPALLITLVAATAVVVTGFVVVDEVSGGEIKQNIQHSTEVAKAYCYQAFGDSSIYVANVVGGHGGYHCLANEHDPHYHQVTQEARQAAHRANQTGEDVDWAEISRYKEQSPTEEYLLELGAVVPIAFVGATVVGVIGLVQRYRNDEEGER